MHADPSFYWQDHLFAFSMLWDFFLPLSLTILPCGADTEIIMFVTSFGLSGCQVIFCVILDVLILGQIHQEK